MIKLAFFDTKPYDRIWFDKLNDFCEISYFEEKLNKHTAKLTEGFDAACAFVNDDICAAAVERMEKNGVKLLAMRCAGYSNVDIHAANGRLHVVRVPAYSPHAVAEFAAALLLTLDRRLHKAYNRTRDFNFNINGLTGTDLYGKTAGIIGTGKIGQIFAGICAGFGMDVLAYDLYPNESSGLKYVELNELFEKSDVISLHCPLTQSTRHILDENAFSRMKTGVFVINTSRGALIDSSALLSALSSGRITGAGLDVYEEEADVFYEDKSDTVERDRTLSLLLGHPNVLLTSHQAFLTNEALSNIAEVTLQNVREFFQKDMLQNEVCYDCATRSIHDSCKRKRGEGCR